MKLVTLENLQINLSNLRHTNLNFLQNNIFEEIKKANVFYNDYLEFQEILKSMGFSCYITSNLTTINLKIFNNFKQLVFSILTHGYEEKWSKIIVLAQQNKHVVLKGNRLISALKFISKGQIFKRLIQDMIIDTTIKNEILTLLEEINFNIKKYHFSIETIKKIKVESCLKQKEIAKFLNNNQEKNYNCVLNFTYGKKILDIYNILVANNISTKEQLMKNEQITTNILDFLNIQKEDIWDFYLDFIFIENILKIGFENQDEILDILIHKDVEVISIKNTKNILKELIKEAHLEFKVEEIFNLKCDKNKKNLINESEIKVDITNIYNLLFKLFKENEHIFPIKDIFVKKFSSYLGINPSSKTSWITKGKEELEKCEKLNYSIDLRKKFIQKFDNFFNTTLLELEEQKDFAHIWSFSLILQQLKINSQSTLFFNSLSVGIRALYEYLNELILVRFLILYKDDIAKFQELFSLIILPNTKIDFSNQETRYVYLTKVLKVFMFNKKYKHRGIDKLKSWNFYKNKIKTSNLYIQIFQSIIKQEQQNNFNFYDFSHWYFSSKDLWNFHIHSFKSFDFIEQDSSNTVESKYKNTREKAQEFDVLLSKIDFKVIEGYTQEIATFASVFLKYIQE